MKRSINSFRLVSVSVVVVIGILSAAVVVTYLTWRPALIGMQTHNDLKWISLALQNYHDVYDSYPPAVVRDDDGNAVHSWRSVIGPYLKAIVETRDNFDAYDLLEPWNSETNLQADTLHRFGNHPYQFLAIVGPHAAWRQSGVRQHSEFTDGTADTVMIIGVEKTDVRWHEPRDAIVNDAGVLTIDGREIPRSDIRFVLTADGSARYVGGTLGEHDLKAMLTIDGSEQVREW